KLLEARLATERVRDPLTGLCGRALFADLTRRALARAGRAGWHTAMFCIDLDHFSKLNQTLGHAAGDELLVLVAQRLGSLARGHDALARFTVSRLGGDEFLLVCENVPGPRAARAIGARLAEALAAPFELAGRQVTATASIGIALAEDAADADAAEGAERLIVDAEVASSQAKEAGGNRHELLDASARQVAAGWVEMERQLRAGIERGELRLHYQPKVALDSDRLVGVEALVRWAHPERGLLPPAEFVPLAERSGLIGALGSWVLTEACRQATDWAERHRGSPPITVAVNLSARQFDRSLAANVAEALARAGTDPQLLCLEVTESLLMADVGAAATTLGELKALGVAVSVDDFGTGYSSLAYLQRLPLDEVKIDKSFVTGLGTNPEDTAIVAAVVAMAHALALTVVAEGVETEDQLGRLRGLGCDYAQGYHLARPQPAAGIDELLGADPERHRLLAGGPRPAAAAGAPPRAQTVLVADDATDVRELARVSLAAGGFSVHEARTGAEALSAALRVRPDCVVLDLGLPDISGLEVCRMLRAAPATYDCTIVVLTSRAGAVDKVDAFSAGADDYMIKPFAPRDLIGRVLSAIRRREATGGQAAPG
ncbi:MAG: EAL domain-containing protein, partial [Mycobacteriales bacterium]